jgi:tail tube GTA-gp10-like protein
MANPYRGEYAFKLGERSFSAKLSFERLVDLEENLGIGVFELAKKFVDGDYGLKEIVATLYAGISDNITKEEFGKLVVEHGVAEQATHCIELLSLALNGKKPCPKDQQ